MILLRLNDMNNKDEEINKDATIQPDHHERRTFDQLNAAQNDMLKMDKGIQGMFLSSLMTLRVACFTPRRETSLQLQL